ncbi:MAG: (d)CMP kinase [Anaerolineaceae bacterium]
MIKATPLESSKLTIAIDGPAASGKTTVGLLLAKALGAICLDTGVMYRAVTQAALEAGIDPLNEKTVVKLARKIKIDVVLSTVDDGRSFDVLVDGVDVTRQLRTDAVNRFVSEVSAYKGVRRAMTKQQQRIAIASNIVMLGRDIGTVVLPQADLKFYLNASAEVRAQRRFEEEKQRGVILDLEQVIASIKHRDQLDSSRKHAPLKPAADAIIIETDGLNVEQVVCRMLGEVNRIMRASMRSEIKSDML